MSELKVGFATFAADIGLYIKIHSGGEVVYAKVYMEACDQWGINFFLRYTNGHIGHLRMTTERNLGVHFVEFGIPTAEELEFTSDKKVPKSMTIFNGDYLVKELPVKDPAAKLKTRNFRSLWEKEPENFPFLYCPVFCPGDYWNMAVAHELCK